MKRFLTLLGAAALGIFLFGSMSVIPAMAAPSATCFTKALNGDVIDPPMCVTPQAHETSGDRYCPAGTHVEYSGRESACVATLDSKLKLNPLGLVGGAMIAMFGMAGILGRGYLPVFSMADGGDGGDGGEPVDPDEPETQEESDSDAGEQQNETIGDPPVDSGE